MRRIVAFVLATGNSKRLPGKNLRSFCGKPLVAWSIIQARCCPRIDKVYVVTESPKIAAIAEEYGVQVIWEPIWMTRTGDIGGTIGVAWAHKKLAEMGIEYDAWSLLLASYPLRKPTDLSDMIQIFDSREMDAVGTSAPMNHISVMKRIGVDANLGIIGGHGGMCNCGGCLMDVSTRESYYRSSWYGMEIDIDKVISRTTKGDPSYVAKHTLFEAEEWQMLDIDYEHEFHIGESLMAHNILYGSAVYENYLLKRQMTGETDG